MEIKKILDELREKKRLAEEIEAILRSRTKLWRIIKDELNQIGETHGGKRRTRIGSSEDMLEFDPEAYIVKENANVVVTRDGWIKRVGRLTSLETTRIREGDSVLAVVPGSTLDHVVFFADDGTAYTMRVTDVPATTGYGDPLGKFFKLDDQVRLVAAATTDERFIPAETKGKKDDPPGPYLLVVTQQGLTLRTHYAPFRAASTKVGRRYVKLNDGDKVVMTEVLSGQEQNLFLASADGRCLLFPIGEINILSGVGKGVIGIKLLDDDRCLGGRIISKGSDALVVETSGGKTMEFTGRYEVVSRGGKGFEAVKRSSFVRVVPPAIALVDWEQMEGDKNGAPRLFD
jgi:DNA gyrase subunit A